MDRRRIPLRALHSEDPYAITRGRPRPPADRLLGQPSLVDDRFAHRGRAAPPSRPIRRRRNVSKAAALVPRATLRFLTLAPSPRQKRGSEIAIAPIASKTGMSAPVCRPSSSRKLTTRLSGGGRVKTPPNTAPSDYPGASRSPCIDAGKPDAHGSRSSFTLTFWRSLPGQIHCVDGVLAD